MRVGKIFFIALGAFQALGAQAYDWDSALLQAHSLVSSPSAYISSDSPINTDTMLPIFALLYENPPTRALLIDGMKRFSMRDFRELLPYITICKMSSDTLGSVANSTIFLQTAMNVPGQIASFDEATAGDLLDAEQNSFLYQEVDDFPFQDHFYVPKTKICLAAGQPFISVYSVLAHELTHLFHANFPKTYSFDDVKDADAYLYNVIAEPGGEMEAYQMTFLALKPYADQIESSLYGQDDSPFASAEGVLKSFSPYLSDDGKTITDPRGFVNYILNLGGGTYKKMNVLNRFISITTIQVNATDRWIQEQLMLDNSQDAIPELTKQLQDPRLKPYQIKVLQQQIDFHQKRIAACTSDIPQQQALKNKADVLLAAEDAK